MTKFTAPWGFSKLDVYRQCPAKFKYQFIDQLPQGSSPAMERGSHIHEGIEAYLNGWTTSLPVEVETWQPHFDELRRRDHRGEQALGLDKDWNLLPDWFDKRTWLRVKMDAYYTRGTEMSVIDFKTGKFRVPSTDQIELYAVAGLSILPTVEAVTAEFWFLDANSSYTQDYTRGQLMDLRKKYEAAVKPLYNEETWKPTPSMECRWCSYSKTKGGPCVY